MIDIFSVLNTSKKTVIKNCRMKTSIALVSLLAVFGFSEGRIFLPSNIHPVSPKLIEFINSINTTWKAGSNFEGVSLKYLKGLMGVLQDKDKHGLPAKVHRSYVILPQSFDARQKWPECPTISQITDQGPCGSCWAVSTAETISDRICIHSNAKVKVEISAQNLLSCCENCGDGCLGGGPEEAWEYWVSDGIVTGGSYKSHVGCQPYTIEHCKHRITGKHPPCGIFVKTPKCVHMCEKGYNVSYAEDKHYGDRSYSIPIDVKEIQTEIYTNGPVAASFAVYSDFIQYKSGVYKRHSDKYLYGHAVKIIGWGVENEVPYWLIANSFGEKWGDKGYFKILRGSNECYIEDSIIAGIPRSYK